MRPVELSKEEIVQDLKNVANEIGRSPTQAEYDSLGKIHSESVARHLGSWNDAKELAGLKKYNRGRRPGTNDWSRIKSRHKTLKDHLPCEECGENRRWCAMEFHHLIPEEKEVGISKMVRDAGVSWKNVVAEMNKCILVCSSCHKEIEAGVR